MNFKGSTLLAMAGALALVVGTAACGGGGSSSSTPSNSGVAVDGYLARCTVKAANGQTAVTDDDGKFTFTPAVTGKITLVGGGTCRDRGYGNAAYTSATAFTGTLTAPAPTSGSGVISPLSTLVQNKIDAAVALGQTLTVEAANTAVVNDFATAGITVPTGVNLATFDPLAVSKAAPTDTAKTALLNISQTIGALANKQVAIATVSALNTAVVAAGTTLNAISTAAPATITTTISNTVDTIAKNSSFVVNPGATVTDYDVNGVAIQPRTITQAISGETVTADLGSLNAANLTKLGNKTGGVVPSLQFTLGALPPASSGTAVVTATLLDITGTDTTKQSTRESGERYIMIENAVFDWSSTTTALTLNAAANTTTKVKYHTATGTGNTTLQEADLKNSDLDVLSAITTTGTTMPQSLKLKVAALFSKLSATSLDPAGSTGKYYYTVTIQGIPLMSYATGAASSTAAKVTTIQGTISAQ